MTHSFKVDDFVRHRTRQDWGYGRIVSVSGPLIVVRFQNGDPDRRFSVEQAPSFLDPVAREQVPPEARSATSGTKTARNPRTGGGPAATCSACNDKLSRSRYSRDGGWKSCPKCSVLHGAHHVYHRYPDDFGTTPKRETAENADGAQSYCTACRKGEAASLDGANVRTCDQLDSREKHP